MALKSSDSIRASEPCYLFDFVWKKKLNFHIKDIHFQSKNGKQKKRKIRLNKGKMVRIWRFERQAYALGERRSIQLSYIRIYQYFTTKGRLLFRKVKFKIYSIHSIKNDQHYHNLLIINSFFTIYILILF